MQHWAEIVQGVFKEKSTCGSHEFPSSGRQPAAWRRQKQKGIGWCWSRETAAPFLLLCSARWPVPSCLLHFGVSQQALPSCAGGREVGVPRLAGCEALHRPIVLLIQSANSPAGVFLQGWISTPLLSKNIPIIQRWMKEENTPCKQAFST